MRKYSSGVWDFKQTMKVYLHFITHFYIHGLRSAAHCLVIKGVQCEELPLHILIVSHIFKSISALKCLGMAALKFFILVVALLLCASLGAGYNCTRRYQRLLREAATVKAQCPNAALHDCCQVGQR